MTVSGLTCLGSRPSLCVEFPMNYSFLNPQLHDTRVFHFLDAVSIPQIGFTHWLTYVFFIFCLMFFFFFVYYFLKLGRGFAALIIPLAVTSELTVFKAWNTCPLVNISILSRFFFPGTVVNYHDICKNSCFLQACLVLYICMNSSQDPFEMFHLNILHLFM